MPKPPTPLITEPLEDFFDNLRPFTMTVVARTRVYSTRANVPTIATLFHLPTIFDTCAEDVHPPIAEATSKRALRVYIDKNPPAIGTIIATGFQDRYKGTHFAGNNEYIQPTMRMIIYVGKLVTIKISEAGKLHILGCREKVHYTRVAETLFRILRKSTGTPFSATFSFITFMCGVVCRMNFKMDLEKVDQYVNACTPYYSLLERTVGNTGANVHIPFTISMDGFTVENVTISETYTPRYHTEQMGAYLDTIPPNEKRDILRKARHNTFIVFHSGSVIMSGMNKPEMRRAFVSFVTLMSDVQSTIEFTS